MVYLCQTSSQFMFKGRKHLLSSQWLIKVGCVYLKAKQTPPPVLYQPCIWCQNDTAMNGHPLVAKVL